MKRTLLVLMFSGLAAAAAWAQVPQPATSIDSRMAQIEAALGGLEAQMERIRVTRDPAERGKLLGEHRRALRQSVTAVRELDRAFSPEMRAMMGGRTQAPSAERMMLEHDVMVRRIALMERLMGQLMEQTMGHLEEAPPK